MGGSMTSLTPMRVFGDSRKSRAASRGSPSAASQCWRAPANAGSSACRRREGGEGVPGRVARPARSAALAGMQAGHLGRGLMEGRAWPRDARGLRTSSVLIAKLVTFSLTRLAPVRRRKPPSTPAPKPLTPKPFVWTKSGRDFPRFNPTLFVFEPPKQTYENAEDFRIRRLAPQDALQHSLAEKKKVDMIAS